MSAFKIRGGGTNFCVFNVTDFDVEEFFYRRLQNEVLHNILGGLLQQPRPSRRAGTLESFQIRSVNPICSPPQ